MYICLISQGVDCNCNTVITAIYLCDLDKCNLIFCCTDRWENYFGLVSQQNNKLGFLNLVFIKPKNKNTDHRGKGNCRQR